MRRAFGSRTHEESGSITPFVVIVSLGILLLTALVVDGGRQLNAKGRGVAYAQEASRAGAQAVDVADPELDLLPSEALKVAAEYCDEAMSADSQLVRCSAEPTTVHDRAGTFQAVEVNTEVEVDAILLGMIGRHTLTSSGTAVARPVSGISEAESGKQSTGGPPSVETPSGSPPGTAPPEPTDQPVEPCDPGDDDDDDDGDDDDKGKDGDKDDKDKDGDKDKDDKDDDDGDGDGDLDPCETPEPGS